MRRELTTEVRRYAPEEILQIVTDWVAFLRQEMLWGSDAPLLPSTRIALGASHRFEVVGIERAHWKSATPIRSIFRAAGLPYFNPHSFRNTLVRFGRAGLSFNDDPARGKEKPPTGPCVTWRPGPGGLALAGR